VDWDDLGNWLTIESLGKELSKQNVQGIRIKDGATITDGDVIGMESSGNIVDVPGKLVTLLGVDNLVIVESDGALLIAGKDRIQDIKKIVEKVKNSRPDLV